MAHHLRILRGAPSPTEVAALAAVLTALAARDAPGAAHRPRERAHWDRGWRAHAPSGSWRSHLPGRRPHDRHP
ncbi:acyl-CoA carboxylase epsilon subunit [Streptomyces solincola]|nr:acyl-CoA carboxylase epsilon subunit [Streptomyces solincola]